MHLIQLGHKEPPRDARELNTVRLKPARESCKMYFLFLWQTVAEPLAEGDDLLIIEESLGCLQDDENALQENYVKWILAVDNKGSSATPVLEACPAEQHREQRWLKPTSIDELFDLFTFGRGKSCKTAFSHEYDECWKKCMPMRQIGQHAR